MCNTESHTRGHGTTTCVDGDALDPKPQDPKPCNRLALSSGERGHLTPAILHRPCENLSVWILNPQPCLVSVWLMNVN